MKTKGFTLIELLAVLVILAVVLTMVVVTVDSIITNSEHSLSEIQKGKVEEAAKAYYLKEGDMTANTACVNVRELISKGYLEGDSVADPETGANLNGSVEIKYLSNQYSYTYKNTTCLNN